MKNFTSSDEKFVYSARMQAVFDDMKKRLHNHDTREGTGTGPACDGKTPFLDMFEKYADEPYEIALAHGIVESWLQSDPVIYPGDLLIGVPRPNRDIKEHFSYGLQCWEGAYEWDVYGDRTEELKERYKKQQHRFDPGNLGRMHERQKQIFGIGGGDAFCALWVTGGYQGHTVPHYQKLLDLGLDGLLREIDDSMKVHGEDNLVLRASRIVVEGMAKWMIMHAECAAEMANEAEGEAKAQLVQVSEVCRAVAHKAPETLHEACQLMWFYCLWDWVDCIGRYDQYIYPFYKKAKEENEAFADELILANMMKFYEHGIHNMTVSGVDPKTGAESTNELTYLLLHILRTFHDSHPRMTVRIGEDTPKDLLMLMVQLWADGMCDPSVCSDKLVIDSFINNYGMPAEDARDYSLLGCQEIEIPGRSNFGCEDGIFNMAKVLEITLNNGANRFDGESHQIGLPTGYISDYDTYEEFENAYFKQLDYFTKYFIELCNIGAEVRAINLSKLVKTVTSDDCIKNGKSLDEGGARYNYGCVETAGSACAADSLYAIKTLVYEEKKISKEDLAAALAADFEGYEEIRQLLRSAPKFGNSHEGADEMATRVLEHFWAEIAKYNTWRGPHEFLGACSLLTGGIWMGGATWATPDGRKKGEPLGNTIGCVPGRDINGLTAMLGSVSKLNLSRGLGGTTCNVLIPKDTTKTEEDRAKVAALIKAFLLSGGLQAQITTANVEELKDAQIHPENHKNLLVRVGGFSVYFDQLGKGVQDEIISRYEA